MDLYSDGSSALADDEVNARRIKIQALADAADTKKREMQEAKEAAQLEEKLYKGTALDKLGVKSGTWEAEAINKLIGKGLDIKLSRDPKVMQRQKDLDDLGPSIHKALEYDRELVAKEASGIPLTFEEQEARVNMGVNLDAPTPVPGLEEEVPARQAISIMEALKANTELDARQDSTTESLYYRGAKSAYDEYKDTISEDSPLLGMFKTGSARVAKNFHTIWQNVNILGSTSNFKQEDIEAFNRSKTGIATKEDNELLDAPITRLDAEGPMSSFFKGQIGKTRREIFESVEERVKASSEIAKIYDIAPEGHSKHIEKLQERLAKAWDRAVPDFDATSKNLDNMDVASAFESSVKGIGKLLLGYGAAVITTPEGVRDQFVENAPQLMMAITPGVGHLAFAGNIAGLALDAYTESLSEYAKKHQGQLPDEKDFQKMALYSAAIGVSEFLGTLFQVRPFTSIFKPASKTSNIAEAARKRALSKEGQAANMAKSGAAGPVKQVTRSELNKEQLEILRTADIKGAVDRFVRGTAEGSLGEGITETGQAYLEPTLQSMFTADVKGRDMFAGGAIGFTVGGMASSPGAALGSMAQFIRDTAAVSMAENEVRNEEIIRAYKARKEKRAEKSKGKKVDTEPEIITDAIKQAGEIVKAGLAVDATPETMADSAAEIKKRVEIAEDKLAAAEEVKSSFAPEVVQEHKDNMAKLQEALEATDPEDTTKVEALQEAIADFTNHIEQSEEAYNEAVEVSKVAQQEIEIIREMQQRLAIAIKPKKTQEQIDEVIITAKSTDRAAAIEAALEIVTLAMDSPESMPIEQARKVARDSSIPFTPEQRTYLQQQTQNRQQEAELSRVGNVSSEIYQGTDRSRKLGIRGYRSEISSALRADDMTLANRLLGNLADFATQHSSKEQAAIEATEYLGTDRNKITRIARDSSGMWTHVPNFNQLSPEQQAQLNTTVIGAASKKMVAAIATEAASLRSALTELQQAVNLKDTSSIPSTTVTETESTTATPSLTEAEINARMQEAAALDADVGIGSQQTTPTTTSAPVPTSSTQVSDNKAGVAPEGSSVPYNDVVMRAGVTDSSGGRFTPESVYGRPIEQLQTEVNALLNKMANKTFSTVDGADMRVLQAEIDRQIQEVIRKGADAEQEVDGVPIFSNENMPEGKEAIQAVLEHIATKEKEGTATEQNLKNKKFLETKLAEIEGADAISETPVKTTEVTEQRTAEDTSDLSDQSIRDSISELRALEESGDITTAESERLQSLEGTLKQREDNAEEEAKGNKGELSLFSVPQVEQGNMTDLEYFRARNLVRDMMKQSSQKRHGGKRNPLVAVMNFISSMMNPNPDATPINIRDFLELKGDVLSTKQTQALSHFFSVALNWNEEIRKDLKANPKYRDKNPVGYFIETVNGETQIDENFLSAISYGAFRWMLINKDRSAGNTDEQINVLMGRSKDAYVTSEQRRILKEVGSYQVFLAPELGRTILRVLGLSSTNKAHLDLQTRLETSVGMVAIKLLDKKGILVRHTISADDMFILSGKENSVATYTYKINLSSQPIKKLLNRYSEVHDGTNNILDALFGTEAAIKQPQFAPNAPVQTRPKNSSLRLPRVLKRLLNKRFKAPRYLRKDLDHLIGGLGSRVMMELAGADMRSVDDVHVSKEIGHKSQYDTIQRNLVLLRQFTTEVKERDPNMDIPFYYDHVVWKQHRVGYDGKVANPLNDKVAREMVYSKEWESTIHFDNLEEVNEFLLAIAAGFGFKTDKEMDATSLEKIKAYLGLYKHKDNNPDIEAAVEALRVREYVNRDAMIPKEGQEAILRVFRNKNDGFATIASLMELAHYKQAKIEGKDSFVARKLVSTDGITNGPVTSNLLLGAAHNKDALLKTLAQGGVYSKNSKHTHYSSWKSSRGNLDMYETLMTDSIELALAELEENPNTLAASNAINWLTNVRDEATLAITGTGRDFIKPALVATVFGSGTSAAVENMAETLIKFIKAHAERISEIQDATEQESERSKLVRAINILLTAETQKDGLKAQYRIPKNIPIKNLLKRDFSDYELRKMKQVFANTFGAGVTHALETNYEVFKRRVQAINDASNMSFALYEAAYDILYQELINGENSGITRANNGEMLHDITIEQDRELRERLRTMYPAVHASMSKGESPMDIGIALNKSERSSNNGPMYEVRSEFNSNFRGTNNTTTRTGAPTIKDIAPGVATNALLTHSVESDVMQTTLETIDGMDTHDAIGVGVLGAKQAAREINKRWIQKIIEYSPTTEAYEALTRAFVGIHSLLNEIESADTTARKDIARDKILTILDRMFSNQDSISPTLFTDMLLEVKSNSYDADLLKLETLLEIENVNQYAREDASYEMTEQDKKRIETLMSSLESEPSQAMIDIAIELDNALAETMDSRFQELKRERAAEAAEAEAKRKERDKGNPLARKTASKRASKTIRRDAPTVVEPEVTDTTDEVITPTDPPLNADPDVAAFNALSLGRVILVLQSIVRTGQIDNKETAIKLLEAIEEGAETFDAAFEKVFPERSIDKLKKGIVNIVISKEIDPETWGKLGESNIRSDKYWVDLFEKKPIITAGEIAVLIKKRLSQSKNKNLALFHRNMLDMIMNVVSKDLPINYVTPQSHKNMVNRIGETSARGWYHPKAGQEAIYVMSPDYISSGLTTETLLHELYHAALAHTIARIETGIAKAKSEGKEYRGKGVQHYNALMELMEKSKEYIAEHGDSLDINPNATKNLHEFVSWGSTNMDFQSKVLTNLSMPDPVKKSGLMNGLTAFFRGITGLLFSNSNKTPAEIDVNGLSQFMIHVSALLKGAANAKEEITYDFKTDFNMDSDGQNEKSHSEKVSELNTIQMFNLLGVKDNVSFAFEEQLLGLLSGIVAKVHGAYGIHKHQADVHKALSPEDRYYKTLETGQAPFVSEIFASGFTVKPQEGYVIDQVQATVRQALSDGSRMTTRAYKELLNLYEQLEAKLTAKDFYDGPNWDAASIDEQMDAQYRRDFIFKMQKGPDGRLDYLSRFAAMGLAHESTNALFNSIKVEQKEEGAPKGFAEALRRIFSNILEWWTNSSLSLNPQAPVASNLHNLIDNLVDIEAEQKSRMMRDPGVIVESIENAIDAVGKGVRGAAVKVATSEAVTESKFVALRLGGKITALSASGRMNFLGKALIDFRNELKNERAGVFSGTIAYVKGFPSSLQNILRYAKGHDRARQDLTTDTATFVLESFAEKGKYLTERQNTSISTFALNTNAQALLDRYTMEEIAEIYRDPTRMFKEIDALENMLTPYKKVKGLMIVRAKDLGYFLATGNGDEFLAMNTDLIANMVDTPSHGKISPSQVAKFKEILSPLVSLYALSYSPQALKGEFLEVLDKEMSREEGNGIEFVLKAHKHLQEDSLATLFDGAEYLRTEGYVPNITDPRISIRVSNDEKLSKLYRDMQFTEIGELEKSIFDGDKEKSTMFVVKDGGINKFVQQIIMMSSPKAKGSANYFKDAQGNVTSTLWSNEVIRIRRAVRLALRDKAKSGPSYNPAKRGTRKGQVPIRSSNGTIVGYRHIMNHSARNNLLNQDNRFEHILGTFAGSTYTKIVSPENNRQAIELLHTMYRDDYGSDPTAYLKITEDTNNLAIKEMYAMLPAKTKKDILEVWGEDAIMVRKELIDIVFGYRAPSISEAFDRDNERRSASTVMFANAFLGMMKAYGKRVKGMDEDTANNYSNRLHIIVRNMEDVWKNIVAETKDIIVVKTGVVLAANTWSNNTVLYMNGVSTKDQIRDHHIGYQATRQYLDDSTALRRAELLLSIDAPGINRRQVEREVLRIKDRMEHNEIAPLYEAGMMPTIVNDVEMSRDPFAYKSQLTEKVHAITDKLPDSVQSTLDFIYMSENTPAYQFLYHATQMSDFVARYVLHKHLTNRAKNPMSNEDAMQSASAAFVNYDIAMPRTVQYIDDMGLIPFTKYFLSIQRVLFDLAREQPGRVAMTLLGNQMLDVFPTVMESSALSRIDNNPLRAGAFRWFGLTADLPTSQALLSIVK